MKKIAIVLVIGLATLFMTPAAVKTQDLRAHPELTLTDGILKTDCYRIYSITRDVLYADVVNIKIGANGLITGFDDLGPYPVCGKRALKATTVKGTKDFVGFFDFPWETLSYSVAYSMVVGSGLKAWSYAFDTSGDPLPPEQIQFVPCSRIVALQASGNYFGQIEK